MVKEYSRADVKKHNDNRGAWIVIHNNIYDVTSFLNEHPGGEEVLLEQAGGDGSEAFEDVGHSTDARTLMCKYKIGEIIESERRPVEEKKGPWETPVTERTPTSILTWIVPIVLGILLTIVYNYYF